MSQFAITQKKNPLQLSCICVVLALMLSLALSTAQACAAQLSVGWNPCTVPVAGYKVYYGVSTGQYTNSVDAGNSLGCTLQNLSDSTYYIAATDYDAYNNTSGFSTELVVQPLTASALTGGSITPSGTFFVTQGANQTFNIAPGVYYHIADVQIDGQSVGPVSSFTMTAVSAPHSITATFALNANCRIITASVGANGSIWPPGQVIVVSGTTLAFKITPAAKYKIAGVKVDRRSIGAVSRYTFRKVKSNHTITASFKPTRQRKSATLVVSGSISPSERPLASSGENRAFTLTPSPNYQLTGVPVDGKSTRSARYASTNVAADDITHAIFSKIPPPVADAGPDQVVKCGSTVTLKGSNSTDNVSGIASYKWTQVSGPAVKLSNTSAPICTFTAPGIGRGNVLAFKLVVTNNGGIIKSDSCLVNVSSTGQASLANAGPGQTVQPYTNVTLDGSGSSDPDGAIASYSWVQIKGRRVAILNANTAHASFVAPDAGPPGASLVFQLQVNDHFGLATRDRCTVNVVNADSLPFADAGPSQVAVTGSSVTLDGSGSYDPDGSPVAYRWKQIRGVPVALSDPTARNPVFIAPSVSDAQSSDLLFMLTVTDANRKLSATGKCVVAVEAQ